MGWASSGFEIGNTLDRRSYPAARPRRTGPPSPGAGPADAGAPAAAAPPQSYVFPFVLRANANTRTTVSSPQLRGPSLVRGLHFSKGGTADGFSGIALGKSLSPITELNVAVATARPYTSLFRGLPQGGTTNGAPNDATSLVDMQASLLTDTDSLGIVVLDRDWFLTVTCATGNTGTPDELHGYLTVLDQVDPQLLALYVG